MKFVVLGATGMLGSELVRVAGSAGLNVYATSRSVEPRFDANLQRFDEFARLAGLSEEDFVVNAIGWIPQKGTGDSAVDQRDANLLNTSLLADIAKTQKLQGFRWLQIGTDCVFSGASGKYSESSRKDAVDLYGHSKIAGETHCDGSIMVRSSIIGPDNRSSAGLYSWFRSQVGKTQIHGFQNHLWNGVTTTAFAKLAVGLAKSEIRQLFQHWVPKGVVTKAELLKLFAENLGFSHDVVQVVESSKTIDRTLVTNNESENEQLWNLAGYDGVPTIADLVSEMVDVDMGRR